MSEYISRLIVWCCTGLFLAITAIDWLGWVTWQQALPVLGLSMRGIAEKGWLFQFVTSPLLHYDLTHLAFNMLSVWMLGPDVETALGRFRYIAFSLLCATSAAVAFLSLDGHSGTIGCGYSGVVYGLIAAQAILFPDRVVNVYAFFPVKMKHAAILFGAAALYFSVVSQSGGTGHASHVAGAVAGFLYLRILRPSRRTHALRTLTGHMRRGTTQAREVFGSRQPRALIQQNASKSWFSFRRGRYQ
jgi:membrane associated rhomboid family serine protease